YRTNSAIRFVASNANEPRRFVPFGVSYDVANLAEGALVGAGDENVWRAFRKAFDNADDLRSRLPAAENHLGKSQARGARMVNARKADVFEMQVLDAVDGFPIVDVAALVRLEQPLKFC